MRPESRVTVPSFLLGAFLAAMGIALIVAQTGLIRVEDVTKYWPAALILLGLSIVARRGGQRRLFAAGILVVMGSWLLLKTLGVVRLNPWEFMGPLLLVAVGARLMLRREHRTARMEGIMTSRTTQAPGSQAPDSAEPAAAGSAADQNELLAVLSGCHRRWSNTVFGGAAATSIMGACELDLREALMDAGGSAHIDVFALMGAVKIFIPPHWVAVLDVTPIMGGVEDKSRSSSSVARQQLFLHGTVVMGGIEITN